MWKCSVAIIVLLAIAPATKAQDATNAQNVGVATAPASVGVSDDAATHDSLGNALADKGDLDAAVVEYRKALEVKPDYAQAHYHLGSALTLKGKLDVSKSEFDAAIVEFKKALELKPDSAEIHVSLGVVLCLEVDPDAAIVEFRKATELKPDMAEAHLALGGALLLGNALADKGDPDAAIVEFKKASELKPDVAEIHNALGTLLALKSDFDAAIVEFKKALELKPDYAAAQKNLRDALNRGGVRSPGVSGTATRPPILGSLEQGKYSNPVIGFQIQLDSTCAIADESRAIASSTELPERLSLGIGCGRGNSLIFSSFPLHEDEEANLSACCWTASLDGVIDGGHFKRHGGLQSQKIAGSDVLVQELIRHGAMGKQLGFYYAFLVGRRYVGILALGPEENRAELSKMAATLKIENR
jgi:tetratricopeptide (TPR) repeat protein